MFGAVAAAIVLVAAGLHFARGPPGGAGASSAARTPGGGGRATGGTAGGGGPTCFALSDTERVRLLGRANTAVHRQIASASGDAQALFDLGLLTAWGFERKGAVDNFMAALRADPRCAM